MQIQPSKPFKIFTTKSTFIITLFVILLTFIGVGFFGVGQHKTLFQISILSISILSITFFLFLTIGLYVGVKFKDNIGNITDQTNRISNYLSNTDWRDIVTASGPDIGGIE